MSVDNNGVRRVERVEMELKLTEEDKLIATMAMGLYNKDMDMLPTECVIRAYAILDATIKQRECRLMVAMEKETRRRRGW